MMDDCCVLNCCGPANKFHAPQSTLKTLLAKRPRTQFKSDRFEMARKVLILLLITGGFMTTAAQYTNVVLSHGTISGLKVFPESSRVPVYTFMGIPYALPPLENLRFAPPQAHPGWNTTLLVRNMQPICLQPELNPYENVQTTGYGNSAGSRTSEDCLYLNIWAPETGFRNGNLPVLAIITGEELAFDWMNNRPTGLDLASEGIVVVTIQFRTNIFGWLALPGSGNFALLDQLEALKWIQTHITKFGGDPTRVTLLGHGTTGASNAMIHLTNFKTENLFSRIIIMSGTIFSSYSFQLHNLSGMGYEYSPTNRIVNNLACDSSEIRFVLACLRRKSTNDLIKAYENVYQAGNYTRLLGPARDGLLIVDDPRVLISMGQFRRMPMIVGICNNEGAFLKDSWIAFGQQGPKVLKKFIDSTIIPNILTHFSFNQYGETQIRDTIEWRYFDQIPKTAPYYMNALQRMVSETHFEVPFFETIEILSRLNDSPNETIMVSSSDLNDNNRKREYEGTSDNLKESLFVYSFQQQTPMDMRGRINYFGGASHSSDLPFLMGPSLLQQIGRRRLTQSEDKLCRMIRQLFGDFIKTGNPTPGRIFDAWKSFTNQRKFIKVLTTSADLTADAPTSDVEKNLVMLDYILTPEEERDSSKNTVNSNVNPYLLKNNGQSQSQTAAGNYLNDGINLQYYQELSRAYSFWRVFLTRIFKGAQQQNDGPRSRNSGDEFEAYDGTGQKFKHAFFSMLTLVCLLLTVLGICVYLLKKNHQTFPKTGSYL